jgi:hypothetical protein
MDVMGELTVGLLLLEAKHAKSLGLLICLLILESEWTTQAYHCDFLSLTSTPFLEELRKVLNNYTMILLCKVAAHLRRCNLHLDIFLIFSMSTVLGSDICRYTLFIAI